MIFRDWYRKGQKHYQAREFRCALECFQQALGLAMSQLACGECYWRIAGCRSKLARS